MVKLRIPKFADALWEKIKVASYVQVKSSIRKRTQGRLTDHPFDSKPNVLPIGSFFFLCMVRFPNQICSALVWKNKKCFSRRGKQKYCSNRRWSRNSAGAQRKLVHPKAQKTSFPKGTEQEKVAKHKEISCTQKRSKHYSHRVWRRNYAGAQRKLARPKVQKTLFPKGMEQERCIKHYPHKEWSRSSAGTRRKLVHPKAQKTLFPKRMEQENVAKHNEISRAQSSYGDCAGRWLS